MLCVTSQDLWQSQLRKSWNRLWIWQKGGGWRISRYTSWRNSKAIRCLTRGISRRLVLPNQWQIMRRKTEEASCARKQTDLTQSWRKVPVIQDCFWLLLRHGPSKIRTLKVKQTAEEGLVPHRNIFREMKKQKSQKSWCISVKLRWACLPLLPPLPPLPPLRQRDQPRLFLFLLSPLSVKSVRWRPLWWSTST